MLIWHTTQPESSHSPPPQREILQCYLGQAQRVMPESLFVLLQLSRHHLPCPEVETSQVHCVSKVTGQLRLTPELLPWRTEGKEEGDKEGRKEGTQIADFFNNKKAFFYCFASLKKNISIVFCVYRDAGVNYGCQIWWHLLLPFIHNVNLHLLRPASARNRITCSHCTT